MDVNGSENESYKKNGSKTGRTRGSNNTKPTLQKRIIQVRGVSDRKIKRNKTR